MSILVLSGCVTRTLTVMSEPSGAEVWLNRKPVGKTPISVPFTHYGTFDIELHKPGYQVHRAAERVAAPAYQRLGIDFAAENLTPHRFHDQHVVQYQLQPVVPVTALDPHAFDIPSPTALRQRSSSGS